MSQKRGRSVIMVEAKDASDMDDLANIVERAKNGDKDAFSLLYTSYYTPIYRYAYFRVRDRFEAEDIAQEVFLKAYNSFSRYVSSGSSPQAYLYAIARNAIVDRYRKKKIPVATDEQADGAIDEGHDPEMDAVRGEERRLIRSKLALLPPDEQDAVVLRFIEGMSTAEVASTLGKSEAAVRQLQSRGLRALKKSIEGYEQ